jgi:hypothetical protein
MYLPFSFFIFLRSLSLPAARKAVKGRPPCDSCVPGDGVWTPY